MKKAIVFIIVLLTLLFLTNTLYVPSLQAEIPNAWIKKTPGQYAWRGWGRFVYQPQSKSVLFYEGYNDGGLRGSTIYANTLYSWDIAANTLTRIKVSNWGIGPPDYPLPENETDPTPANRHTYRGFEYVPVRDAVYMVGGANSRTPGLDLNSMWVYSFQTGSWRKTTQHPTGGNEGHLNYVPGTNSLFYMVNSEVWKFDLTAETWTLIKSNTQRFWGAPSTVDSKRNLIIFYGGDGTKNLVTYDPATNIFTTQSTAGPTLLGQIVYNSKWDVYLVFDLETSNTWIYYPTTKLWEKLAVASSPPIFRLKEVGYAAYDQANDVVGISGYANGPEFWVLQYVPYQVPTGAPYPASSVIEGITWDSPSTIVRKAQGSDNWPTTWGPDGNIYTAWGDGGGFGGSDAGLGVARLEGAPSNFVGTNLWSTPRGYRGGKSYGIISIDGILYMFAGPYSDWSGSTETWLQWSNDLGKTWQYSEIFFHYSDGFSMPAFLNFGKDYAGARDNYVYVYSYDTSLGSNGPYTKINLARVLKTDIRNRSAYEFFSGLDANSNPAWTQSVANRQPVFIDSAHGVLMPSVSYNSGINRYLLVVTHNDGNAGGWPVNTGGLGIFDAPNPWGPWTTVEYTNNWLGSTNMFFANIPTKQPDWLSSDGKTFHLVFTGYGSDPIAQDAYQHIRGVFISAGPDTTPPTIISVTCSSPASVVILFSEPVEQASSTNISNYSINQGISIYSASLGQDLKTVTLTTSSHQEGITYTLTVNNIKDRAKTPNTIASNTQKTYTYISKLIISNLTVASGKTYKVVDSGLQIGALVYIDRSYTFISIPSLLQGSTYIKTANEDKASTGASFLSFDVNQEVTLYIAHDNRITTKPSWLASFTDTGLDLSTDDTTFSLFSKDYPAGNISLGANEGAGGSMYSVIIIGKGAILPTGDINQDNQVDVLDIQALVNHILGIQDYGARADVNTDGSVDVLDVQGVVNIILGG